MLAVPNDMHFGYPRSYAHIAKCGKTMLNLSVRKLPALLTQQIESNSFQIIIVFFCVVVCVPFFDFGLSKVRILLIYSIRVVYLPLTVLYLPYVINSSSLMYISLDPPSREVVQCLAFCPYISPR